MRDPQNQEGVDVGLLGQLSVRPRVNGPAPAEVDVRAEHSPKPPRPAGPLNRQRAGAPGAMEIPLELSPQGRVRGRIRPAGQRRGTLLRPAKLLPKRRECRTVQNHGLIELLDQTPEHIGGKTLPGLALDPRWNLGQGIQSLDVTANMHPY